MQRQVRALLAWLDRAEAIPTLLGHMPGPNDGTSAQVAIWETARNAMAAREPYQLPAPTLEVVPTELAERAQAFRQRPDVLSIFQNMDWTVGMVDLRTVLSFQKLVVEEQAMDRVATANADDLHTLFSLCLPEQAANVALAAIMDNDQKGVTFSSLNPNLRVVGHAVQEVAVSPGPKQPAQTMKFVGFAVNFGAQFVQVAEYNGRWFVRDGYDRCYGLLRRGIRRIPCIFIQARSFQELGAQAPGFLSYELLFGDRPPFLIDFLDDAVSVFAQQRATRKVIRITAQEFVVEI
jgi:hypothetical protein